VSIPLVLGALETGLPYRDQMVLTQLASHARDDGTSCRPSVDRLAKRCGMNRTTVMDATASLEDLGWLVRVHVGQRVHYLLDAPRLVALADQISRRGRPDESPRPTGSSQGSCNEPAERHQPAAAAGAAGPAARTVPAAAPRGLPHPWSIDARHVTPAPSRDVRASVQSGPSASGRAAEDSGPGKALPERTTDVTSVVTQLLQRCTR
jgi:Helix-turn-helix domain